MSADLTDTGAHGTGVIRPENCKREGYWASGQPN